ncbi:MAG: ABC transporter ATP-binding protein [Desulfobacteraceae bacterium]|nr:ABC transporter ATP-binding protein [Desulfobacteraceae bacterium]
MSLIEVKNLRTYFDTWTGTVRAVDSIDFTIEREKTLGVVGESGCGKSVTARTIMNIIPMPPGRIQSGEIWFHGNGGKIDLTRLGPNSDDMRTIRGNEIAMIFQEPMTSLNPAYTIGNQIVEAIMLHQDLTKKEAAHKTVDMLRAVGISSPRQRSREYPHQLSGGMRQRAMIAMALSCNPSLLIADEPTTALDVTIQAQVLDLMNRLREEYRTSIMFITHDLGVIAEMADDVMVMYLGRVVERAPVRDLFHNPLHPYTRGLLNSIPSLTARRTDKLVPITGTVPDPFDVPMGCGFQPRCHQSKKSCKTNAPGLKSVGNGHQVACFSAQTAATGQA